MPCTALVVRVAEADSLVAELRMRFDDTARLGVPAHITVLFPFMAPDEVTAHVISEAKSVFESIPPFDFELRAVCRWPETTFLAPTPAQPFVNLTQAIVKKFPGYPTYAGRHDQIVPHLTVAHGNSEQAAIAEAELRPLFDVSGLVKARCTEVELLENSTGLWRTMQALPLGKRCS